MRKIVKKTAIVILLAFTLVGCGEKERVIEGTVTNAVTDNGTAEAENEAATAAGEPQNDSENAGQGYTFEAQGVTIAIDADAEAYIEALTELISYYEAPSCAFGDLDKIYTYSGFELDTYSINGRDYVKSIILQDDSVMTPEGVCIGDAAEKIEEIYGAASSADDEMMLYVKDNMKLCFLIREGQVVSIEYLSTVLD